MPGRFACAWCGYLLDGEACEFESSPAAHEEAAESILCAVCAGKVLAAIDAAVDRGGGVEKGEIGDGATDRLCLVRLFDGQQGV